MPVRRVYIAGASLLKVEEHWGESIDSMVTRVFDGLVETRPQNIDHVVVANAVGEVLQGQGNLGALVAEDLGITGVPSVRVEAGSASGAAALYAGFQAILSGLANTVLVLGVEKLSDATAEEVTTLSTISERYDYVGYQGITEAAIAAMIYRLYLEKYELPQEMIAQFPVIMHEHGSKAPHAQFQFKTTLEAVLSSPIVSPPLRRLETTAPADGAAALLLCSSENLHRVGHEHVVEVAGAASSTDFISPFDREDPLRLSAVSRAFQQAMAMAGMVRDEIKALEIHDSYSILAGLILESIGFSPPGQSGVDVKNGEYSFGGKTVVNSFGGLKARGHPWGATGVYQAVEIYLQLTGQAGGCQIDGARGGAMISLAGLGSAAYAFIMRCV